MALQGADPGSRAHRRAAVMIKTVQSSLMARAPQRRTKKTEPAERALAQAITAAPVLSRPDDARATVAAWRKEIAGTTAGKSLARLLGPSDKVRALVDGIADGSPFLWELARSEPARLLVLLQSDPDLHLARL